MKFTKTEASALNFETIKSGFLQWLETIAPNLLAAAGIVLLGWWLSNLLGKLAWRALSRAKTDQGAASFIASLVKSLLKVLVCVIAAAQLGMNVASIVTALGAAGITAGLALKDSLSNVASGAQIIFTKPFLAGDYLSIDDVEGTVDRIEIMFTTLRTFDNKQIVIPNSKITQSVITNYTAMKTRRLDVSYVVAYDDDITAAKNLLAKLVAAHRLVLQSPPPMTAVGKHLENGVEIVAQMWCHTEDYWPLYYQLQEQVKLALDKNGFHIPLPQLEIRRKD